MPMKMEDIRVPFQWHSNFTVVQITDYHLPRPLSLHLLSILPSYYLLLNHFDEGLKDSFNVYIHRTFYRKQMTSANLEN